MNAKSYDSFHKCIHSVSEGHSLDEIVSKCQYQYARLIDKINHAEKIGKFLDFDLSGKPEISYYLDYTPIFHQV